MLVEPLANTTVGQKKVEFTLFQPWLLILVTDHRLLGLVNFTKLADVAFQMVVSTDRYPKLAKMPCPAAEKR